MPVAIYLRSVWGAYVRAEDRAQASAPPVPGSPWEPWKGGVFIHYRGSFFSFDPHTEEDCRRDIASVFEDDLDDGDPDIEYNFLVCPHGNIYEGRGYERGEANYHQPDVQYEPGSFVGRNTGFYSICGLIAAPDYPTEDMLLSIRNLIAHLRNYHQSDRRAGPLILPHSFEYDTACPGNLSPYAMAGSSIDPAVPWNGPLRIDQNVLAAQRWVNQRFDGVPGYIPCRETGRTGWATVLSLTQGLQHELGISPTVQNFGPGTFQAVKNRGLRADTETNLTIVTIYNSALWCKGYWATDPPYLWGERARQSMQELIAGMGLANAVVTDDLWAQIVRALLRMDQFRVVPGGDATIGTIQQRLNYRYVYERAIPAMKLVPCDGIYSRDVQTGLMMAIQYHVGIPPANINGNFGPGTQAGLRSTGSAGLTGDFRNLFRSACYVNSPTYDDTQEVRYLPADIDTDTATATHTHWLRTFQEFSQIPVTATNEFTTWAQLLVSSGDTERPATGCDCITEITLERGQLLRTSGYQIVGRYLDEHLVPGEPGYLGKALRPGELSNIFAAGLRMFPIFQWNGTQLENFTFAKGQEQAGVAHNRARQFGLPENTCIYFAVDYDALDIDIDSNIIPYFRGVGSTLENLGGYYQFGVYGSRNICNRVSHEVGARWSFVSGMSWGYSGNLGFPLPANWSFNQIREYEFQPGWGLDHNVWRVDGDTGVSFLST